MTSSLSLVFFRNHHLTRSSSLFQFLIIPPRLLQSLIISLWFYLTFAVSSTMLPSESDRHAWLNLVIAVGVLSAFALFVGAGPWMLSNVAPILSNFLSSVAVIFGLSAAVHAILVLPTLLVHKLLARITGVDVR